MLDTILSMSLIIGLFSVTGISLTLLAIAAGLVKV